MNKKRFTIVLVTCMILSIGIIISDYFDLPSRLGIKIDHINMDLLSIVISNAVVIILFLITFHFIDARNLKAEEKQLLVIDNKRAIGLHMLKKTCLNCQEEINILTPEVIKKYVIPKVDFNLPGDNELVKSLKNSPFTFEDQLNTLFIDGSLYGPELDMYDNLKRKYRDFITISITLFDVPSETSKYQHRCKIASDMLINHCEGERLRLRKIVPVKKKSNTKA